MKNIYVFLACLLLIACQNNAQPQDPIPTHDSFTIESKILSETRTINVWTPPNYKTTSDSLTVLYMPDGGINEDFPHIANTLAELIESKRIKPVILVGIENTVRRRDLSSPTEVEEDKKIAPVIGGAEKFRTFINEELFEEVEKRYRTKAEKGIIGESLAGLFIVETLFNHPDMFDFYIAMDPSLWWNNQHLVKNAKTNLAQFPTSPKQFWFAGSNAKDIAKHTKELAKILTEVNPTNLKWAYSNEPKEKHHTIYRATKEKALVWALGN
jgi:predicted alpha/beta superfamily hydrolase